MSIHFNRQSTKFEIRILEYWWILPTSKCKWSPCFFGTHKHGRAAPVKAPILVDSITDSMLFDYRKIRQISASAPIFSWFDHGFLPIPVQVLTSNNSSAFFSKFIDVNPQLKPGLAPKNDANIASHRVMFGMVKSPLLLACWRSFCSSNCFSFLGIALWQKGTKSGSEQILWGRWTWRLEKTKQTGTVTM